MKRIILLFSLLFTLTLYTQALELEDVYSGDSIVISDQTLDNIAYYTGASNHYSYRGAEKILPVQLCGYRYVDGEVIRDFVQEAEITTSRYAYYTCDTCNEKLGAAEEATALKYVREKVLTKSESIPLHAESSQLILSWSDDKLFTQNWYFRTEKFNDVKRISSSSLLTCSKGHYTFVTGYEYYKTDLIDRHTATTHGVGLPLPTKITYNNCIFPSGYYLKDSAGRNVGALGGDSHANATVTFNDCTFNGLVNASNLDKVTSCIFNAETYLTAQISERNTFNLNCEIVCSTSDSDTFKGDCTVTATSIKNCSTYGNNSIVTGHVIGHNSNGMSLTIQNDILSPSTLTIQGSGSLTLNNCSGTLDLSQWSGNSIVGNGNTTINLSKNWPGKGNMTIKNININKSYKTLQKK